MLHHAQVKLKIVKTPTQPQLNSTYYNLNERVHSEMKICDKIKLSSNIVLFAFISSDVDSGRNISLPGLLHYHLQRPALAPPRTCIITSEDMHFHLWDLHHCFRACIFTSGTCIILPGPALFYRISSVKKIKTNGRKLTKSAQSLKCPFREGKFLFLSRPSH